MLVIFTLVGAFAFVVDVLNPVTPNPVVSRRVFFLALTLALAIRTLIVIMRIPRAKSCEHVVDVSEATSWRVWFDVLDVTCICLR